MLIRMSCFNSRHFENLQYGICRRGMSSQGNTASNMFLGKAESELVQLLKSDVSTMVPIPSMVPKP